MSLLGRFECMQYFFNKISERRSGGQIPNDVFDFFKEIFSFILKKFEKKTDFNIFHNILLLSQTFWCIKDGNKIYLEKEIKNEKIFKQKTFGNNF